MSNFLAKTKGIFIYRWNFHEIYLSRILVNMLGVSEIDIDLIGIFWMNFERKTLFTYIVNKFDSLRIHISMILQRC